MMGFPVYDVYYTGSSGKKQCRPGKFTGRSQDADHWVGQNEAGIEMPFAIWPKTVDNLLGIIYNMFTLYKEVFLMKKIICLVLALVTIFTMTACSVVIPIGATGNNLGSKVGEASTKFLGLFSVNVDEAGKITLVDGDSSVATAAKNGGITKISTVDVKLVLDKVFFTITTVVTGE